ncbi:hypothetical protein D3C71_1191300 [compost metagenome]
MAGHHVQLTFVDDQHIQQREQRIGQDLCRRRVERDLEPGRTCAAGIGGDGGHGRFQLQQQPAHALQCRQVFLAKPEVGAGRDRDRVLGGVGQADEGGTGGQRRIAHGRHGHTGIAQRRLDRRGEIILAHGQQHACRHTAGPRAGYGLVGAFATGERAEATAQHRLTGRRHMRGAHHEIEIGRAGDKDSGTCRTTHGSIASSTRL